MQAVAIGFFWGGFFATATLLVAGGLIVFVLSQHRVALQASFTALLSALFVVSYLGLLPVLDSASELRLVADAGILSATMLGLMLLLDLGMLRERQARRRILWHTGVLAALAIVMSWLLSAVQALALGTLLAFGVAFVALAVSVRSAWGGDRVAWVAAFALTCALVLLGGLTWIAVNRDGGWLVHAVSANAGIAYLMGIGAMLWLRYSYLIELREVLAQGPRYDPITRMRTNAASGHMVAQAFTRQQNSSRPLVLIAVSIGNLYALENLHGRASVNHALFVCASRLRRCVPADVDMGRLGDDGFVLVSRNARDMERLMKVGRRVARQLSLPVTLHTTTDADEPEEQQTEWAAQVGVGVIATTARAKPSAVVAKVRDMSRTAWTFESRVAWHDQGSDTIAELPMLDSAR